MTKKNTAKTDKKDAKKIKKLKSTQKDLEKKIVDLSSQVDKLSKKSSKLKSKLHKERETGFSKKLAKLQADFDKRVAELTAVNQSPVAEPKQTVRAAVKRTVAKSPAAAKPRTAPAKPRVVKKPSVASIVGVGPMTQKKLAEAGITTLAQIANPPAPVKTALKQFEKVRGYNTWQAQAKKLLA